MSVFATYGVLAGAGKLDADAAAFLAAAGITDATIKATINKFVKALKTNGLWTKAKAIYPFVGGSASAHKWNLKDPRDLDAAHRIVFGGTMAHSVNGITGNGTNAYYDTKLNPSTALAQNSASVFLYYKTSTVGVDGRFDIGAGVGTSNRFYYVKRSAINNTQGSINGAINGHAFPGSTGSTGFGGASRVDSTGFFMINESATANKTMASVAPPNLNVFGMCYNNAGTAAGFTSLTHAFCWLGDGLTTTEAGTLRTIVNQLQTDLGR